MAEKKKILTKVKKISFTPWNEAGTGLESQSVILNDIVADSVAITQDDPEKSQIDCETRDEPIIESVTQGKYQVTMDSANIGYDVLETCMGFKKIGSPETLAAAAPADYVEKYVRVDIELAEGVFLLPRVLLTSKIDASSLKTNVAKGTLSGTAYSANVTVGSESSPVVTPFLVVNPGVEVAVQALA